MRRKFSSKNLAGTAAVDQRAAQMPLLRICLLRTRYQMPWICNGFTAPGQLAEPGTDPRTYRGQLAALKADLRAALAEVEAHEKVILGLARQESKLALAELESGLQDALRQVVKMKRQLRQ